ncbi:Chloride channel protein 2 [Orchesella cincta]|uniref:Chloride channel protein n=1 Tax=Orchesella cincta TaxID=48709 RepID=A0A1D2NB10_ORCCI|nr:Chloride channel protein 2 [Orchesella cincta]
MNNLVPDTMEYVLTPMMYGRYTSDLAQYAKEEARRLKILEKKRKRDEKIRKKELRDRYRNPYVKAVIKGFSYVWQRSFARLGEDWVFLAILGVLMAVLSFIMDWGISMCNKARIWLYMDLNYHISIQYFAWIILPVCLVLFSAGLVHIIAPQAIGSGIPEMKTILRGVTLKEYLTFRTLFAKVIGLTASLGSGMPLGKEGPFVHIASIVATLMTKLQSFHGIYENESRSNEMLAAACAVGVACCFAAPVGGVLFSIEVTAVYFAVRDYWRGFFAAGIGAMFFRLLAVWFQGHETIKPVFKTFFGSEFPYDPQELVVFAIIGVLSGLFGALFVWMHRQYVLWMRGNKRLNQFLQKNRFIYPFVVSWFIASANFPLGFGQFIAGDLTTHDQVLTLFSNFSWTKENFTVEEVSIMRHWVNPHTGIFINLTIYFVVTFFLFIVASTLPVPSGNFVPVFKMGAAMGRIIGEAMHLWFPYGISFSGDRWPVVPGGYAVVGAAAFSGAVTRTISIVVIVSEMTGQITHIIPVMLAVLISNAVAGVLQPSIFDSISMIKKLPYLPDFIPSSSAGAYNITVRDFMIRDVKFIWYSMTYEELKEVLKENRTISSFPIIDSPDGMILLGSIPRQHLIKAIERHIGRERRIQCAAQWRKEVAEKARIEEEQERKRLLELQQRRPSRFEVVPVPTIVTTKPDSTSVDSIRSTDHTMTVGGFERGSGSLLSPTHDGRPKSILKKTNSFSLHNFGQFPSKFHPYMTVTGAEDRLRSAFHTIFQKSTQLPDANPDAAAKEDMRRSPSPTPLSPPPTTPKKVQLPSERVIDMSPEEQKGWEEEEMVSAVDFTKCPIDAAPFQLVAGTTLLKVHSIFSLLGINHSYVTATGKLIGVVAMKELRIAIEQCNSGTFRRPSMAVPRIETTTDQEQEDLEGLGGSKDELNSLDSALDTEAEETTDDEGQRLS